MSRHILVQGPVENLWGVRTTYGTHPHPPRRVTRRVARAGRAVAVAALAAWYFVRR